MVYIWRSGARMRCVYIIVIAVIINEVIVIDVTYHFCLFMDIFYLLRTNRTNITATPFMTLLCFQLPFWRNQNAKKHGYTIDWSVHTFVCARVRACACARARACVCACACLRVRVRACLRVCVHGSMCACREYILACVYTYWDWHTQYV